ncbi:LSU ribosomal protein L22P [Hathewaya proteolytica DSM 3090]|uniref:Large ribosomal subunit protein uL22 n=1 Tax=Hathewaya proteolytica DSM 3090 TaxID=1121331 RepID=A0A1M6SRR6_9CLOT|nr:50S ribosomal protein L22 [Hathewaya proteolytica]SHK47356.1 LSU ribosomal protein L22P [Hathewaya proteolytica DSM 3090]
MEAKAIAKHVRMSSIKIGRVLNLVRGKNVREAEAILKYTPQDAAVVINKVLKSAVANAEHNYNLDINRLYVAEAYAGQSATLKRFRPRARGTAYEIKKRTSHITVIVRERN